MYSALAQSIQQMEALIDLEQSGLYDFWTRVHFNFPTDIMVAPEQLEEFLGVLNNFDIEYWIKIEDVQE